MPNFLKLNKNLSMKAYYIDEMEELRTAIIAEGILKEKFHDDNLKERLFELKPLEFIPYFIMNSNIRYNDFFFSLICHIGKN